MSQTQTIPPKAQLVSPETLKVQEKLATLNLTGAPAPLRLGNSLNKYEKADLTPTIGTEFAKGVQLSELLKAPNADELIRDLAITVSQRGVVFFRDQDITIEEQRVLGQKLGQLTGKPESSKLHIHPTTEPESEKGDEVTIITSERRKPYEKFDQTQLSAANWHADIAFEAVPSDYAILKIHTLPEIGRKAVGGDTLWASGYEVYDRLSPSFAKYLETLEAVNEARFIRTVVSELGNKYRDDVDRGSPGNVGDHLEAIHPVIRTNPVTGWKSVFVNPGQTKRVLGVTRDESDAILKHLFGLVQLNHDLQVRFKWEKNSLAIWDNRSNFHTATWDYGSQTRIGDRVVSIGERPYFDPNSKSRRGALGLKEY